MLNQFVTFYFNGARLFCVRTSEWTVCSLHCCCLNWLGHLHLVSLLLDDGGLDWTYRVSSWSWNGVVELVVEMLPADSILNPGWDLLDWDFGVSYLVLLGLALLLSSWLNELNIAQVGAWSTFVLVLLAIPDDRVESVWCQFFLADFIAYSLLLLWRFFGGNELVNARWAAVVRSEGWQFLDLDLHFRFLEHIWRARVWRLTSAEEWGHCSR